MLKENRNIDDSYTDRVIKQLAKETQIDFKAGRVNLPLANYSWPFNHFGPGGLENALAIRKSSNFAKHIVNTYGVDDEEFKEILAMYIGVIAGRIQDGLERENSPWLQEQIGHGGVRKGDDERESQYAAQVVDWMVKETKIDDSHDDPSQWNIYAPHMGRWISPLGFISPNNRHWSAFENHVMDIYGLDWEMVGTAWNNYLKEVTTTFRLLAGRAQGDDSLQYDYLAESLSSRVKKEVDDLWDEDKKLKDEDKIKKYFEDKGLDKQDADEAMVQYLSKQQSLNESKEDLDSYIHKVVNRMVDNTHLSGEEIGNIRVKLPFSIKSHMPFIDQLDKMVDNTMK